MVTSHAKRFDVIETCWHVEPYRNGFDKAPQRDEEACDRLWRYFYNEIPRAWPEMVGWIPLDDILLVDDLGDAFKERGSPASTAGARGDRRSGRSRSLSSREDLHPKGFAPAAGPGVDREL
jgi:hypothetical protein